MNTNIKQYIEKMGYKVQSKPYEVMAIADAWYSNEVVEGFHDRKTVQNTPYSLERTNMAKRCCSDDADLLEVVSIQSQSEAVQYVLQEVFAGSNFEKMLRRQLEHVSAVGTGGAYLRIVGAEEYDNGEVRGGEIKINYAKGQDIIPLSVENEAVTECAFTGVDILDGKKVTSLVIFTEDAGRYKARTVYFNDTWKVIQTLDIEYPEGMVPFALLTVADTNNIKDMHGFGVPKIWNAVSYLKGVDLAWTVFLRDLSKADKLVLMNERMLKFDDNGKVIRPNKEAQELFCFLGEKLPDEKSLVQEYNPVIRVDELTKAMELNLSMLSNMFGYGTRKYSFDNSQIKTATEYIGERQDMMQELNKQRAVVEGYIKTLCKGIVYLHNSQTGTALDPEDEITIDFDDSYINDKETMLKDMRDDIMALGLPAITEKYLMTKYKITEEEARAWMEDKPFDDNEDMMV